MKIYIVISLSLLFGLTHINAQGQKEIVPGTRVSLTPPDGFTPGQNFSGYQKGEEAMINIMDLSGGNFYSNTATFTRENFEAKGITVVEYKELTIDGYPAKYIIAVGDVDAISFNMVFGDSTFSVMLMSVYPSNDKKLAKQIKRSIMSASYLKDITIDPFAAALFSLDDSNTKLKFSKSSANVFIYTIGGESENNDGKPMLMVLPLPSNGTATEKEISESMIASLQEKGLSDIEYVSNSNAPINGYKAYELVVKGKMSGVTLNLIVQTITNGSNQIVIQGIQNGGLFSAETIRELSKTITMK